jgi:hypothetical protein
MSFSEALERTTNERSVTIISFTFKNTDEKNSLIRKFYICLKLQINWKGLTYWVTFSKPSSLNNYVTVTSFKLKNSNSFFCNLVE